MEFERDQRSQLEALVQQEIKVRLALAEMHYRKAVYDAAISHLDRLIALDPTSSTNYYNRARAFEAIGDSPGARRDYEKFLGTTKLPTGDGRVAHAFEYTHGS